LKIFYIFFRSNFDNTGPQLASTGGQEADTDAPPQELPFESGSRRGGRGHFRSRTFRNNRNFGGDRPNPYEREGGEGGQDDYRPNRRQYEREGGEGGQPRTNVS
jgi:hypothetical protein